MSERIRGQETQIRVVSDGVLQKEIDEIKSFDFTYQVKIQTEEFLGRTSNEKDEIYQGINGTIEFQPRSLQVFDLLETIKARAQRRGANPPIINISFVAVFPNGDRPRLVIKDAKFQDPGLKSPGRSQFVTAPWSFEASDAKYSPA
jgi:hypothetical protein